MFGNGVTRYIVSPSTSGAASWPFWVPSENVQATFSRPTLPVLMSASGLKRVLA